MIAPLEPVIGRVRRFCPDCAQFTDSWMDGAVERCARCQPPPPPGMYWDDDDE